jgi:hypothetical protein
MSKRKRAIVHTNLLPLTTTLEPTTQTKLEQLRSFMGDTLPTTTDRYTVQRTNQQYDAAQTAGCNALLARLQSIASLAVEAQQFDPSGDVTIDQLDTIAADLEIAIAIARSLNRDDVYVAETIAKTGQVKR